MSDNSASVPSEERTDVIRSKTRVEADAVMPPCSAEAYERTLTPGEWAVVEARLDLLAALARLDEAELMWWTELKTVTSSKTIGSPLVVINSGYYRGKHVAEVLCVPDDYPPGQVCLKSQGGPTTVRHLAPPTRADLEAYETAMLLKVLERRSLTKDETRAVKAVLRLSQLEDGERVTTVVVESEPGGLPVQKYRHDEVRVSRHKPKPVK